MTGTATQRHQAMRAATQAKQPRGRLIHCRPSGRLLLVALVDAGGALQLLRVTKADAPGLEVLPGADRSRVAGALLCLHQRRAGEPRAA